MSYHSTYCVRIGFKLVHRNKFLVCISIVLNVCFLFESMYLLFYNDIKVWLGLSITSLHLFGGYVNLWSNNLFLMITL